MVVKGKADKVPVTLMMRFGHDSFYDVLAGWKSFAALYLREGKFRVHSGRCICICICICRLNLN